MTSIKSWTCTNECLQCVAQCYTVNEPHSKNIRISSHLHNRAKLHGVIAYHEDVKSDDAFRMSQGVQSQGLFWLVPASQPRIACISLGCNISAYLYLRINEIKRKSTIRGTWQSGLQHISTTSYISWLLFLKHNETNAIPERYDDILDSSDHGHPETLGGKEQSATSKRDLFCGCAKVDLSIRPSGWSPYGQSLFTYAHTAANFDEADLEALWYNQGGICFCKQCMHPCYVRRTAVRCWQRELYHKCRIL